MAKYWLKCSLAYALYIRLLGNRTFIAWKETSQFGIQYSLKKRLFQNMFQFGMSFVPEYAHSSTGNGSVVRFWYCTWKFLGCFCKKIRKCSSSELIRGNDFVPYGRSGYFRHANVMLMIYWDSRQFRKHFVQNNSGACIYGWGFRSKYLNHGRPQKPQNIIFFTWFIRGKDNFLFNDSLQSLLMCVNRNF